VFVPKSKRGTIAQLETQQQKAEEAEQRRAREAEKKALQSRALVAEAVAVAAKDGAAQREDEGDEVDVAEAAGDFLAVPDDADPAPGGDDAAAGGAAAALARDAWEVRELLRVLRDADAARDARREEEERARRRALTDEARRAEDVRSGRYRAPGEARRGGKKGEGGGDTKEGQYLQRYHHRGAFYMDEDTLARAGKDDVRRRAAEYSRAATGTDKIDRSSLPELMQVKYFGFAGHSTKYKGLAKEDTTDKRQDFLPIRGPGSGRGRSKHN